MEGEQVVNEQLVVHLTDAWNKVSDPWDVDPYDTWTQEGIPLDHLRSGAACARAAADDPACRVLARRRMRKDRRVPTFRRGLPPRSS
jgi:hypothetical protein